MEVVELFRLDKATHEFEAFQVLAWAHAHSVKIDLGHGFDHARARWFAILFASLNAPGDRLSQPYTERYTCR